MIRPQVVAHRGSSARHADNSWPAFEAAVREGADAIECDVQATRDRVIIVRHDLTIDDRLVADLCFAEIEARAPGTVVLADLLPFAESTPIDLLVEIKDPSAAEAVALFCYQAKKWVGAFAAALGGLDTLVFAGGIGENNPSIRARICEGLGFLGIELNEPINRENAPVISAQNSRVAVRIIHTDEELMIARSVCRVLGLGAVNEKHY